MCCSTVGPQCTYNFSSAISESLTIFHIQYHVDKRYMVMFLVLHPMESISLNSFVLLEHLAMLLSSTLAINCLLRNFLNKAIGIINFAKHFQNFIGNTMI